MKVNKRTIITLVGILFLILIAYFFNPSNFSIKEASMTNNTSDMAIEYYPEIAFTEEIEMNNVFDRDKVESKKEVTNIYISLETLEFVPTTDNLSSLIEKYKGYIENSSISHNNYINNKVYKHANYTVRIPKDNIKSFVNEINSIGNVISENTSNQNITKQYYDTESRLNVLKIKEERILALLEKAEKIEDIISIENQLSEIIYQKESLTKSLLDMDDMVSYSTVNINISEVEKLTNGITKETGFITKISNAFHDSLYFFKITLEKFVVIVIYVVPYLLIGGIIVTIAYKISKKRQKNNGM